MSSATARATRDDERPLPRERLPLEVLRHGDEIGLRWHEEVVVGLTGARITQPMELWERQQVSWSRIKRPLLATLELYHAKARELDQAQKRVEELEARVQQLEAEAVKREQAHQGALAQARGRRKDG